MNLNEIILRYVSFLLLPFTDKFMSSLSKNKAVQEMVRLYDNDKFLPIRFWDAPFLEVEKSIPRKGKILDLGCGEGIFTNFLGLSSKGRKIIGIEIDQDRIRRADKKLRNVTFKKGNIINLGFPPYDHVILFNVLHHLSSYVDQEKLIGKIAKRLKTNSKLFIIEVNKNYGFKYFLSWFVDYFIVAWVFDKKIISEKILFRSSKQWRNLLREKGFNTKEVDLSHNKPFAHFLLIATKLNR